MENVDLITMISLKILHKTSNTRTEVLMIEKIHYIIEQSLSFEKILLSNCGTIKPTSFALFFLKVLKKNIGHGTIINYGISGRK